MIKMCSAKQNKRKFEANAIQITVYQVSITFYKEKVSIR